MELTWLGGASFRLRSRDAAVVTEPFAHGIVPRSAMPKADLVTLSRTPPEPVTDVPVRPANDERSPYVIDGPGEFEIAGVHVRGVEQFALPADQRSTIYAIDIDGLNVGVMGRLAAEPAEALLDELGTLHVLLIDTAGGEGWLSLTDTMHLITRIEPNIVIPYYSLDGDILEAQQGWERLVRELSGTPMAPENNLTIARSSLPEPVSVRLLEPRAK